LCLQVGQNLEYASDELKNDREIVLKAVANYHSTDGLAFQNCSIGSRGDREIVLAAVSKHGHNIKYASDELKNDREIVMLAIANDHSTKGLALQNCSIDSRGDSEIVLAAVDEIWNMLLMN
jgi:hypothetical protein